MSVKRRHESSRSRSHDAASASKKVIRRKSDSAQEPASDLQALAEQQQSSATRSVADKPAKVIKLKKTAPEAACHSAKSADSADELDVDSVHAQYQLLIGAEPSKKKARSNRHLSLTEMTSGAHSVSPPTEKSAGVVAACKAAETVSDNASCESTVSDEGYERLLKLRLQQKFSKAPHAESSVVSQSVGLAAQPQFSQTVIEYLQLESKPESQGVDDYLGFSKAPKCSREQSTTAESHSARSSAAPLVDASTAQQRGPVIPAVGKTGAFSFFSSSSAVLLALSSAANNKPGPRSVSFLLSPTDSFCIPL